jgi:hypothetical protein
MGDLGGVAYASQAPPLSSPIGSQLNSTLSVLLLDDGLIE